MSANGHGPIVGKHNVLPSSDDEKVDSLVISLANLNELGPRVRALSSESAASTSSQANYAKPEETLLIFDWDDTLCPSNWAKQVGLTSYGPDGRPLKFSLYQKELSALSWSVHATLKAAMSKGKVIIVTNAEEGWIELSCRRWMPTLCELLRSIQCVSARSTWEPHGLKAPFDWKAMEFEKVIERFYSKRLHQSWKNVLSIGDSPHERDALIRATCGSLPVDVYDRRKRSRCRTKTIKFKVRPTIEELTQELNVLAESMEFLVNHDDSLDIMLGPHSVPATSPDRIEQYVSPIVMETLGPQGPRSGQI
jgi:hypothetical protein